MSGSVVHQNGHQQMPGVENGHMAVWQKGDTAPSEVVEQIGHLTLDAPSSVSVSIDWTTCHEASGGYGNQVELATKNYVASYGMALSHALAQAGTPAERLDISAAASSIDPNAGPPTIYVEVRGRAPGLDQAGFESIARQAEHASTIWNALLGAYWPGTPEVRLNVILVEPTAPEVASEQPLTETASSVPPPSTGSAAPHVSPSREAGQTIDPAVTRAHDDSPNAPAPRPAFASELAPVDGAVPLAQPGRSEVSPQVTPQAATPNVRHESMARPPLSPAIPAAPLQARSNGGDEHSAPLRVTPPSPQEPVESARSRRGSVPTRWVVFALAAVLVGGIALTDVGSQVPDMVTIDPDDLQALLSRPSTSEPGRAVTSLPANAPPAGAGPAERPGASREGARAPTAAVVEAQARAQAGGQRLQGGQPVAVGAPPTAAAPTTTSLPVPPASEPALAADVRTSAAPPDSGSGSPGVRARSETLFTSRPAGWPDDSQSTAWFVSDGYRLAARHPSRFVSIGAPVDGQIRDVVVTGSFRKVGGPPGGGYGLIVRADGSVRGDGIDQGGHYYVFEVGDLGEVGIWRRDVDRWTDLLTWTRSEAVRPGGASNDLEVRAIGQHFTFLVNGTIVAELDNSALHEGRVGIFAGGDFNEVLVERFGVEKLE